MATSTISESSSGMVWNNLWRQPLRPATTSPSFFPCRSLNSQNENVSTRKTRYKLDTQIPGRDYCSLPSTPPQPDSFFGKGLELNGKRVPSTQRADNIIEMEAAKRDENGNGFLPEWYVESCINFMNVPRSKEKPKSEHKVEPLDHPQKRETYLLDSLYDEDGNFSERSQSMDCEGCSFVNPSSGEVSKLNSLGMGQSRLMSLFSSLGNVSSCSITPSISEASDEQLVASVSDDVSSDNCLDEAEITSGIEAVRTGLARLLSIPTDMDTQLKCDSIECTKTEVEERIRNETGSRLIKLFPSSIARSEDDTDWETNSPLEISTLWKSESSLEHCQSQVSSQASSERNSPTMITPDQEISSFSSVKVPNISSISPTAPLHFNTTPSFQIQERFPNHDESVQSFTINTSVFTACDLSTEETEIEAALERGDGFYTKEDDIPSKEIQQMDDAIWSPSVAQTCMDHFEDVLESEAVDQKLFKEFSVETASDIIDWLDIWLSQCSTGFHGRLTDDLKTMSISSHSDEEPLQNVDNAEVDATAMSFYAMCATTGNDEAWRRIMNLGNDDLEADSQIQERDFYAQLTQSPGILDLLIERDRQEKEEQECDSTQTHFPGSSLHFMLNSRASNIYDSYLLFPDLMHFTSPMKSDCIELDESSLFSHLFSSSFDWMSSLDVLDPAHNNVWDRTLQSLSPKTPFTPTGNLNDNLHTFEKKHSITMEQLCNLATVASSLESVDMEYSSLLSTDFFFQYLQSQLGCIDNIAIFNSPTLKKELIEESSRTEYLKEDCTKIYRPVPIFPLQFINRLSLTSSEQCKEKESLLFSPSTHFRPITPKPEVETTEVSCDDECSGNTNRKPYFETVSDDVDEELVAIHEGADHAKLAEIYAQMQLKQQLAAEQKQNYPQPMTVDGDGNMEEENAYEEKHVAGISYEHEVADHALDCAAEAAASAAVNALGSAEPAEALAILEDWRWKEAAEEEEESLLAKTFPDLGYFETNHDFQPKNDFFQITGSENTPQSASFLAETICPTSTSWSIEDGSCIDQDFEYDNIKKIWIKTGDNANIESLVSAEVENGDSFFHDQSCFDQQAGKIGQNLSLSPISVPNNSLRNNTSLDNPHYRSDYDEEDDGIVDPYSSPLKAPYEDIGIKYLTAQLGQPSQAGRKELHREKYSHHKISSLNHTHDKNLPTYLVNTDNASWNFVWANKVHDDDDGIDMMHKTTLFDQTDLVLQEEHCANSSIDDDYHDGYNGFKGSKDKRLVNPG